jgi:hypothetical protein
MATREHKGHKTRSKPHRVGFGSKGSGSMIVMSDTLQYLTDEAGTKTAVVLSISDYEKLLEDLDDLATVAERRDEPSIPHEQFKAELKRDGIL